MKKPSGFWQNSLDSMHPSLRIRYIAWFGMAETMDQSFDAALGLWRGANDGAMQAWQSLMR